uniref:Uncharacterized protein n=1 Tax=Anopheles quadriannulatus TaxID=34691 RepID=A0A182XT47_ANOQN
MCFDATTIIVCVYLTHYYQQHDDSLISVVKKQAKKAL